MTENPMTMVERMARAAYEACPEMDHVASKWVAWDDLDEYARLVYRQRQRAALGELRDPTPRMIEAGMNAASVTLAEEWRAMVDAERGEEGKS